MKDINAQEYAELIKSDSPVVIDFHATWCGPCKVLSPILEELSDEVDGVEFVKLDVDQHPEIAGANGVMGVPTVVMLKGGEVKERFVGVQPKEIIKDKFYHIRDYEGPCVIKPINGGSSVDVTIIKNSKMEPLKKNQNYNELMAEVLVGTRELTVTVLKERPLCVTEITSNKKQDFYNYKAKYDQNGSSHIIPALIPKTIFDKAMSWALRAHQIIGCKGISRTDFRYDSNHNKLFMLELNTQPGMTETSLAPEQALFCQITMKQMVKTLMEEATYEC